MFFTTISKDSAFFRFCGRWYFDQTEILLWRARHPERHVVTGCHLFWLGFWATVICGFCLCLAALAAHGITTLMFSFVYVPLVADVNIITAYKLMVSAMTGDINTLSEFTLAVGQIVGFVFLLAGLVLAIGFSIYGLSKLHKRRQARLFEAKLFQDLINEACPPEPAKPSVFAIWYKQLKDKTCIPIRIV